MAVSLKRLYSETNPFELKGKELKLEIEADKLLAQAQREEREAAHAVNLPYKPQAFSEYYLQFREQRRNTFILDEPDELPNAPEQHLWECDWREIRKLADEAGLSYFQTLILERRYNGESFQTIADTLPERFRCCRQTAANELHKAIDTIHTVTDAGVESTLAEVFEMSIYVIREMLKVRRRVLG